MTAGPNRSNPGWYWEETWHEFIRPDVQPHTFELIETEREAIGTLLGPDGRPVVTVYDRTPVAFGFQPRQVAS